MAGLWGDYTDVVISQIDASLGAGYGKLNLRKFLADPTKFATQSNIVSDAQKMKNDVDKYFDAVLEDLAEQSKALDDMLLKAESITNQLSNNISMQAKQNKRPVIKPILVERDITKDERIYVDGVDAGVLSLVEKLVETSTYIADSTSAYRDRRIGEWVFGGTKNYVLRVYLPQNEVMLVEGARDEINTLFGISLNFIKGQTKKN